MNASKLQQFRELYFDALLDARTTYPDEYVWPVEQLAYVSARMMAAVERGSFNKDSRAIKAVCKQLGIKHTYAAISAFLERAS